MKTSPQAISTHQERVLVRFDKIIEAENQGMQVGARLQEHSGSSWPSLLRFDYFLISIPLDGCW